MISQTQQAITSEATVVFEDAAVSFALPAGATWADLAEIMSDMGEGHEAPRYVRVKCAGKPVAPSRRLAA